MDSLDIIKHVQSNYNRYIVYLINKKRGADGLTLDRQEAEEVLDNLLHEYLENPTGLDKRFIWNRLKSRRIDFIRGKTREAEAYERYSHLYYTEPDDSLHTTLRRDMIETIQEEIGKARPASQEILTDHYIDGKPIHSEDRNAQRVRDRFRNKMIDKYGG